MAKKPPTSYAAVELTPTEPLPAPVTASTSETRTSPSRTTGRTLKETASPVMLYLHPEGAKALKRYALDQNTKVHSLLIEAVEAWFKSHGLREPVRVPTERPGTG